MKNKILKFLESRYEPSKKSKEIFAAFLILCALPISQIKAGDLAQIVTAILAFRALYNWQHQKKAENFIKTVNSFFEAIFTIRDCLVDLKIKKQSYKKICQINEDGSKKILSKFNQGSSERYEWEVKLLERDTRNGKEHKEEMEPIVRNLVEARSEAETALLFLSLDQEEVFKKIILYQPKDEEDVGQIYLDFVRMLKDAKEVLKKKFPKKFKLIFIK